MSHHMQVRDWHINYNGDFSGNIEFIAPTGEHYGIPFEIVLSVVAQKVRYDRISAIESSTDDSLLGLDPGWPSLTGDVQPDAPHNEG